MKRFNESTLQLMETKFSDLEDSTIALQIDIARRERLSLETHIEKLEEKESESDIEGLFSSYILEYKAKINDCIILEIKAREAQIIRAQDRLALSN
jgi:hypothetical protein